jgi:hypothetical protein
VPSSATFVCAQDEYGALSNNFIGATTSDPTMSLALQTAADEVNRGDHGMIWLTTGPGLLTRAFARALSSSNKGLRVLEHVSIFRLAQLQPFVAFWYPLAYKRDRFRFNVQERLRLRSRRNLTI